mmetsp:Transcript_43956/g.71469  ORF Transcript_43956/g.71469 Transcript_43956/m.71469 type:complete len:92 (+) Transcript_43956:968-1243(+)
MWGIAILPFGSRAGNKTAQQNSWVIVTAADCSWSQSQAGALLTQSCDGKNEYSSESGIRIPNLGVSSVLLQPLQSCLDIIPRCLKGMSGSH